MRLALLLAVVLGSTLLFTCGAGGGGGDGGGAVNCPGTGGGSGGTGVNLGAVNGKPFVVGSSAAQRDATCDYQRGSCLAIRLSEDSATCDPVGPYGQLHPGLRTATLVIHRAADAGTVGVGTHTGSLLVAALPAGSCDAGQPGGTSGALTYQQVAVDGANAATVTIDAIAPTVRGSFTATLSSGGSLQGTFDAPFCTYRDWEISAAVRCVP